MNSSKINRSILSDLIEKHHRRILVSQTKFSQSSRREKSKTSALALKNSWINSKKITKKLQKKNRWRIWKILKIEFFSIKSNSNFDLIIQVIWNFVEKTESRKISVKNNLSISLFYLSFCPRNFQRKKKQKNVKKNWKLSIL